MNLRQFRYAADNLGYLVWHDGNAVAIDGGAVDEILAFAQARGLRIRWVTNTHGHGDHTRGNEALLDRTGAEFLDWRRFSHGAGVAPGAHPLVAYRTPGHMADGVTFQAGPALITGDTLFNGTVGNCFSGDLNAFFASIRFLLAFAPETRIYAGHDYVRQSMAFARALEGENPWIDGYLARYNPAHVVSSLADELQVNPYLRFNDPAMIRILRARGLPVETESDRWHSLMSLG
jgi:hydroxyacylglutathione hydrolase